MTACCVSGAVSKDGISLIHGDSLQALRGYGDKQFDWAIIDPPYGIDVANDSRFGKKSSSKAATKTKDYTKKDWDLGVPTTEFWDELFRVSKNQIIWGANYFVEHINKPTKGWVVWYKGQEGLTMSDAELAFSSFDTATRVVKINRVELLKEGTIHPTQKPVKLYDWILNQYASEGNLILDTHVGSGSSRIACEKGGFNFVGFEIDKDYYAKQEKRFKNFTAQQRLF